VCSTCALFKTRATYCSNLAVRCRLPTVWSLKESALDTPDHLFNQLAPVSLVSLQGQVAFITDRGRDAHCRAPRPDPSTRNSRTRLPPWVLDGEAVIGPRVKDSRCRQPGRGDFRHPLPCQLILLPSTPQRASSQVRKPRQGNGSGSPYDTARAERCLLDHGHPFVRPPEKCLLSGAESTRQSREAAPRKRHRPDSGVIDSGVTDPWPFARRLPGFSAPRRSRLV